MENKTKNKSTETGPRPWIDKITEFNKIKISNPNWTLQQIADHLEINVRTVYRILLVSDHLYDPKISRSLTLNQAYDRIKILYPNYRTPTDKIKNQISDIATKFFGETKE